MSDIAAHLWAALVSTRKELRIRPGFTPEEDVAKYRSSGKRESERLKGFVPGATSASSATYVSDFPSLGGPSSSSTLSKAQKKNLARSNKRAEAQADAAQEDSWWDDDEELKSTTSAAAAAAGAGTDSAAADAMAKLSVKDSDKKPPTSAKTPPSAAKAPKAPTPTPTPPPPRKELRPPRPGGGGLAGLQAIVSANAAANAQKKR